MSYPQGAVWDDSAYYKNQCPGEQVRNGKGCIGKKGGGKGDNAICGGSPIVIDTAGSGFSHFTDPEKECILFNLRGSGKPMCLSWPEHGFGLAWLVLERKDGRNIDSGKQLFGNFTPQKGHPSKDPNGFLALAEYDLPKHGGKLDGVIDKKDKVWKKLRLWIDDHCYLHRDKPCSSLPYELHQLEEFGITSISTMYHYDPRSDQWGNNLKFWGYMNVAVPTVDRPGSLQESPNSQKNRIVDIYLVKKK